MMQQVLFLCTGNYYRSRFAEMLFNHHARAGRLNWQADSRGLALELGAGNIGPLSPFARAGLLERGVPVPELPRRPEPAIAPDFSAADLIVALKESEHRPLLMRRFPEWIDAVEYWHVDDIDCAEPVDALALIEQHVEDLLRRLAGL